MKTYFLCGIGGSGLSALAVWLRRNGATVRGSDRSRDGGTVLPVFEALEREGVELFAQDGSGVVCGVDEVVVSSAVEEQVPDVRAARALGIPVRRRAEVLADILNERDGIAVGGTSGKSTVTAMLGHILRAAGLDPTVINGGESIGEPAGGLGNIVTGLGRHCVVEADESDGTIELYRPSVAVLTNVSLDHKSMAELRALFGGFVGAARAGVVLNADCAESMALANRARRVTTFGVGGGADYAVTDFESAGWGSRFRLGSLSVRLQVPGVHNAANAAAAVAAAERVGVSAGVAIAALGDFRGVRRRLEVVGSSGGVTVIDDFAHNPDKIRASLATLRAGGGPVIVVYQPHGHGPTRLCWDGLVDSFGGGLGRADLLIVLPVFYAGGSVREKVSSVDLAEAIAGRGVRAVSAADRAVAAELVVAEACAGSLVAVMGARDGTLTPFAKGLVARIGERLGAG